MFEIRRLNTFIFFTNDIINENEQVVAEITNRYAR